jgi:hypothetical protein
MLKNGSCEFTQCTLINSTINDIRLKDAKVKSVPVKVSLRLHTLKDNPPFNLDFNYKSVVGKFNYLAQTTRPNIMYAMHQITKNSSDLGQSYGKAILFLVSYLRKASDLGLEFKPDSKNGFKYYCDADFSQNCNKEFAPVDPSTAKSQSGWIIFYAGCPISWVGVAVIKNY